MPLINLFTLIDAPIERCFDLARSIDLHKLSTGNTGEEAIAGRMSGLIGVNETVTWRAKHLGVWQTLTSKITAYEYPTLFRDEMMEGAFKCIRHDHKFKTVDGKTLMEDEFYFESPFGIAGSIFNSLFLTEYLRKLLDERNKMIKQYAEGEEWKEILSA